MEREDENVSCAEGTPGDGPGGSAESSGKRMVKKAMKEEFQMERNCL